jgi:hypothetical protein
MKITCGLNLQMEENWEFPYCYGLPLLMEKPRSGVLSIDVSLMYIPLPPSLVPLSCHCKWERAGGEGMRENEARENNL